MDPDHEAGGSPNVSAFVFNYIWAGRATIPNGELQTLSRVGLLKG